MILNLIQEMDFVFMQSRFNACSDMFWKCHHWGILFFRCWDCCIVESHTPLLLKFGYPVTIIKGSLPAFCLRKKFQIFPLFWERSSHQPVSAACLWEACIRKNGWILWNFPKRGGGVIFLQFFGFKTNILVIGFGHKFDYIGSYVVIFGHIGSCY